MAGVDARRVLFLLQERTDVQVAEQLGLSAGAVREIAGGEVLLGGELRDSVRNYYQRESYARARATGMSANIARGVRTLAPETVMDRIITFTDRALQFTEGVAGARIENRLNAGEELTQTDIDEIYAETYQKVLDGLSHSRASFKEIMSEKY